MKSFIFFTSEGCTYYNLHNHTNNMKLLSDDKGKNIVEDSRYFKINQHHYQKLKNEER